MEDLKIGTAEIVYSETGVILRAFFVPKMEIGNIANELTKIQGVNPVSIKQSAEMILSSWFNKMNEVELADREKYKIVSEILSCSYYQNGNIRRCKILFTFKEIHPALL